MELSAVKGIGEARAEQLKRLGINTAEELVTHFPREYQDRSKLTPIAELQPDETASIKAKVAGMNLSRPNNKILVKAVLRDDSGELEAVWFNKPYLKTAFKAGYYVFTGRVVQRLGKLQMDSPDYEPYSDNMLSSGRIVPVYHATAGLSQKMLRGFIRSALEKFEDADMLNEDVQKKYGLCPRGYAVRNIHFPESGEAFFHARRRLVFEELFEIQIKLMRLKKNMKQSAAVMVQGVDFKPVLSRFEFSPTKAQERVLDEIMADMSSGRRMNRLVQGDVGSGKTLVAMLAAYAVVQNSGQAALMAPTEVLAVQHCRSFDVFEEMGLHVAFLSGSQTKSERRRALEDISSGSARMIIGTHALIQESVRFKELGLVITDEQHRFGVRQRAELGRNSPHVLVMTATPIPRSLALILYGDMDISIIDSLPPGRTKVDTYAVTTAYRERLYKFIRGQIIEGRQAYMICPAIEESEGMESAEVLAERMTRVFDGYTVKMLHGRMRPEERQWIMARFSEGEIDILVSTTVIEVGVNVPNATVMAIENAERFGLAQLHQLRGRVGRGAHKSYCVLITDSKSKICKERLKALKASNDGFYISELDLKLRGGGDFFGTRQHGLPEFKIANLYQDMDILKLAQEAAADLAYEEPGEWVVI